MLKTIIYIWFTIVWVKSGYKVYEGYDDLPHKIVTALIVSLVIWFIWFK